MSKLAFSSVTVINVNDGNGIVSSSTSYAISPFGNDVPIEEMIDEEGNILFDSDD
jgi:hypothetical protein